MSAMKNSAAITCLNLFSLNRTSFIIAFSTAALVIAKLVDAYLFCGFNQNFFVDVPLGAVLFFGYCITPLLGLAVKRKPTTKGGRCCRMFAIVLICSWQLLTFCAILVFIEFQYIVASRNDKADYDPFNVCGNRTVDNVRTQFSNATATFDIFQRIDLIYKSAITVGWVVLLLFPMVAFVLFTASLFEISRNHQACEDPESGKFPEANDETIIWMEERGEGSIDIEDESAPDDATREVEDRKSEIGSVDVRMENLRNEANEPGSNAEPQSKEAKEPELSVVDEEEEATTTKSADEVSQ